MEYDVIVIGAGPGGSECAKKCAKKGLKTAIVEKNFPGGDAINDGYFPLKVLLSGEHRTDEVKVLEERIKKASFGWHDKLKKSGVDVIEGTAKIIDNNNIEVEAGMHTYKMYSKYLVLATGNTPISPLEGIELDGKGLISYRHIMKACKSGKMTGEKIAILGGDVEGCEFATFFSHSNVDVTIFEAQDNIMPLCDRETGDYLYESFVSQGIKVKTKTKVIDCHYTNEGYKLIFEQNKPEIFDRVLMTGKSIPSLPVGFDSLGLSFKEDGYVRVNPSMKTNLDNVYAIGDVIGGVTSANAAILEGRTAALNIAGYLSVADYSTMPYVFFTRPQISAVGLREVDAKSQNIPYKVGKIDFKYNLRALSLGYESGFVKVLISPGVSPGENNIIGIHLVGDNISELITLPTLAYAKSISAGEITSLPLPHPTMGEIILEAVEEAI